MLALDRPEVADAGTDICSHHVGVRFVDHQATVLHRLVRGGERKMCKGSHPPSFLFIEKAKRIETLNLASKLNRELFRVKFLDVVGAVGAVHQSGPRCRNIVADRRNRSKSCNYYSTLHIGKS